MSHISTIEVAIQDLDTLQRACLELDLEFARGVQRFKHYTGYGACDHVIRVPGAEYEIGVVRSDDAYTLQWDDWHLGGLEQRLGKGAGRLKQAYAAERVRTEARRKGMRVRMRRNESTVQLVLSAQ
ncbi:MAG: DUF1257 domain-containing protein [Oceanidesulfovibrio sp.]